MKSITLEKNKLGFIGIGFMGRPIAQRLLEAGFKLTAYDRNRSKAEELIRYGGTVAESVAEVASSCDVVLSCLPSDQAVLDVYREPGGIFANAGSTPIAEKGLLTLFGGGNEECFDAAESIFRVMAQKYFYLGQSGAGATMKLVVNTLLGIGMQAIAEAVALGEKAGLARNRLLDVLSQTAVVAPAHVGKLQRAKNSDYSPQFPIRLMNKDFGLIFDLAAHVGAQMPAADAAFEVNARQSDEGAEQDFSAVILQMEKQAHLGTGEDGKTGVGIASAANFHGLPAGFI
jgi:3-hydroxyisobutyrate dehydrogenase-like beta-hydroxyacid dehydrogenase